MTTGETIRNLRKYRKLRQGDLAKLAGLSTTTIVNIEKGYFMPTLNTLNKIAKALRLKSVKQLFDGQ